MMKNLAPSYLEALVVVSLVGVVVRLSSQHPVRNVEAFTPSSFKKPKHASVAVLNENVDDGQHHDLAVATLERRRVLNGLAAAFVSVVSSTYSTPAAFADDVKTMDLSLPTYDSINTLKSSDAERGLGVENPSPPSSSGGSSSGVSKKKKSFSSGGGGGGGGNPLGSVLPSMNKSVTKKPKTPKSEGSSNKKFRSSSPATADDDDSGIKTMDLSLPSYSDSAKTASKSVFSL
mmetsp:Transcript_62619/g.152448  ORF Transcript_62619/g.152448 Transcript_62619/m.152448 type:complete len:232 (+) Transcript_62619:189-884(+)